MSNTKVKCLQCGSEILPATYADTGGYCRNPKCNADRKTAARTEQRRISVETRVRAGTLQACPRCGNLVRKSKIEGHTNRRCEKRPMPHPFADVFPRKEVPDWLSSLAAAPELPTPIPLNHILAESCYYPSSGLDASPVIILNGFIHSFVFADYGIKHTDYLKELSEAGFRGYKRLLERDVEKDEIVPPHWMPHMPIHFGDFNRPDCVLDGQRNYVSFGHWSIWKRQEMFDDRIGPPMFSLFFLAGEGVACFQGLYERNDIAPKAVAIIQPGHAFGNNWTNFFDPDGPFWQTVESSAGTPDYLLVGTIGDGRVKRDDCPFDGYRFEQRTRTTERRTGREMTHTIDIFRSYEETTS